MIFQSICLDNPFEKYICSNNNRMSFEKSYHAIENENLTYDRNR